MGEVLWHAGAIAEAVGEKEAAEGYRRRLR
jgi:hypothetical protein